MLQPEDFPKGPTTNECPLRRNSSDLEAIDAFGADHSVCERSGTSRSKIRNPEATGFAKKQEAGLQLARGRNCAGSTRQLHSSDAGR